MAQKVVTSLVDDLDESVADETVRFALDGQEFEIDLNRTHAVELRDALAKYKASARKVSGRRTNPQRQSAGVRYTATPTESGRRVKPTVDREQNEAVRTWARSQGAIVGDKGRIPAAISEAYQAGDPGLIPEQKLTAAAKAARVKDRQVTQQATLDVTTEPVEQAPEAPAREWFEPALLPEVASQLTRPQKEQVAEWAVTEGILDRPSVGKVNRDLIGNYKATMARRLADA